MAKLERKEAKIFASSAGETLVTAFRTAEIDSPIYTKDPDAIQNDKYLVGWLDTVVSGNKLPFVEDMNGLFNAITYNTSYLYQQGIPEYLNTQEYCTNSFCQVDGVIYKSKIDDNKNNPPASSPDAWDVFDTAPTTASNIGDDGYGVFSSKVGNDFQFKKITVGSGLTITDTGEVIEIGITGGEGGAEYLRLAGGTMIGTLVTQSIVPETSNIVKNIGSTESSYGNIYINHALHTTRNDGSIRFGSAKTPNVSLKAVDGQGLLINADYGGFGTANVTGGLIAGTITATNASVNSSFSAGAITATNTISATGNISTSSSMLVNGTGMLRATRSVSGNDCYESIRINSSGSGVVYANKDMILNAGTSGSTSAHTIALHLDETEKYLFTASEATFNSRLVIDTNSTDGVKLVRNFYNPDLKWSNWFRLGINASQRAEIYSETMSVYITAKGKSYSFGDGTAGVVSGSDERIKKNVVNMQDGVLDIINALRPVKYDLKNETKNTSKHAGFIAQETDVILPDLTVPPTTEDGYYGIDYAGFVPYLVKAVQELSAEVKELKQRLDRI